MSTMLTEPSSKFVTYSFPATGSVAIPWVLLPSGSVFWTVGNACAA